MHRRAIHKARIPLVLSSTCSNSLARSVKRVFDVVSVGHFSIDSIQLPDKKSPFVVLGGAAAYVSLAARRLGARVAVVSKVGSDFPEAYRWWLGQEGIDLSNVSKDDNARTTRFELKYSSDLSERSLLSECRAHPIRIEDLLHVPKAEIIHIGPIANEIDFDVVQKLKSLAHIVSLDPQGLVRSFDEKGIVTINPLADNRVLGLVDIFKSSLAEIQTITEQSEISSAVTSIHEYGTKIVVVTLGAKGSVVSVEGTIHNVPPFTPEKLVDPTGAGDAFMGGFLAEYARGEDSSWCSCVGSAIASLVIEGIGPTHFGDIDEIYRRARLLYEKGIKE
ncbi:MAG TPA: carbohydrate kinase family protein [Candidatus Bathyarchaeia archaeon]|nr:carbohydrate kinase family protein [Candidatus Bathyarchaeia archaeon]